MQGKMGSSPPQPLAVQSQSQSSNPGLLTLFLRDDSYSHPSILFVFLSVFHVSGTILGPRDSAPVLMVLTFQRKQIVKKLSYVITNKNIISVVTSARSQST